MHGGPIVQDGHALAPASVGWCVSDVVTQLFSAIVRIVRVTAHNAPTSHDVCVGGIVGEGVGQVFHAPVDQEETRGNVGRMEAVVVGSSSSSIHVILPGQRKSSETPFSNAEIQLGTDHHGKYVFEGFEFLFDLAAVVTTNGTSVHSLVADVIVNVGRTIVHEFASDRF